VTICRRSVDGAFVEDAALRDAGVISDEHRELSDICPS
jgi:hypothetical protein